MTYILNNPLHLNAAGTKCEILLRFLDLPVEVYRIKWEQLQTPEYLHKHPLGKHSGRPPKREDHLRNTRIQHKPNQIGLWSWEKGLSLGSEDCW